MVPAAYHSKYVGAPLILPVVSAMDLDLFGLQVVFFSHSIVRKMTERVGNHVFE